MTHHKPSLGDRTNNVHGATPPDTSGHAADQQNSDQQGHQQNTSNQGGNMQYNDQQNAGQGDGQNGGQQTRAQRRGSRSQGQNSQGQGSQGQDSQDQNSDTAGSFSNAITDATAPLQRDGCPKVIDAATHGMIDYAFSAVCLLAPTLLRLNGPSGKLCRAVGLGTLAINALSDTPVGVKKVIPFETHAKAELPVLPMLAAATLLSKPRRAKGLFLTLLLAGLTNYMFTDYTSGGSQDNADDDNNARSSGPQRRGSSSRRSNQASSSGTSRRQRTTTSGTPGRTAHESDDTTSDRQDTRTTDSAGAGSGGDSAT